jgi:uncharacterized protein YdeI (YjbR/CyaY-like superfamily)
MKPTNIQFFDSAEHFQSWMLAHHATAAPTWVAIAKLGSKHHVLTYQEALDVALCHGWIDGVVGRIDEDHYAARFSARRPGSNWSVVNVKRFAQLQASGLVHVSGLLAFESRDRAVSEDQTAELDEDSLAALRANAAAWAFFDRQPPGYRRQASWFVMSARTPATKARRLQKLLALSASGQRLPGF